MTRRRKSPEAFGLTQVKLPLATVRSVPEGPVVVEDEKEQGPVVADEGTCCLTRLDQRVIPDYDRRDNRGRPVRRIWHPQGRTVGSATRRRSTE